MTAFDAAAVAAASNAWIWYPDDATVVDTADYLLVRYPDHYTHRLELQRFCPAAPAEKALDEVVEKAHSFGLPQLHAWVKLDAPEGFEELLRARGGTLLETTDVLARPLTDLPDLAVPERVETRWRTDLPTAVDCNRVFVEAWEEGELEPEEELRAVAADSAEEYAAGRGGAVVAYVDGRPVGAGGVSLVDGVARFWGSAVVPEARHRGAYRAMVAARLAYAVEHGASMALVKGRVSTSAPTLRRAGFEAYGQERSYLLPLGEG